MNWLGDMAISDELPDYWELGSVDWKDGSDELLDLVIWYNNGYACEPYPEEEPVLAIETVGGVKVLTVGGVGILDDTFLNDIIESSIHRVNQWWTCRYWWINFRLNFWKLQSRRRFRRGETGECDTPFYKLEKPAKWKYNGGNLYWSSGDINYILEGHAMAHLGIPSDYAWFLVCKWKNIVWKKDPSCGTWYWWNKGYNEYGSRMDW